MEMIGLIAGNGSFPLAFAREAKKRGYEVAAVAHRGETDDRLTSEVASLDWIRVGQLGAMIRAFQRRGVSRAVMAGGINKVRSLARLRPDLRGIAFLARAVSLGDDALLRALAAELEKEGIQIVPSTTFLERLLVVSGHIAGPVPPPRALADIRVGVEALAGIGHLDIGQAVVVENGAVLAVEAIEGTDEMIRRAAGFTHGKAVVVKAAKKGQDLRFDVPAAGPRTIESMARSGALVLALQAGVAIILEGDELTTRARAEGVCVVGFDEGGEVNGLG